MKVRFWKTIELPWVLIIVWFWAAVLVNETNDQKQNTYGQVSKDSTPNVWVSSKPVRKIHFDSLKEWNVPTSKIFKNTVWDTKILSTDTMFLQRPNSKKIWFRISSDFFLSKTLRFFLIKDVKFLYQLLVWFHHWKLKKLKLCSPRLLVIIILSHTKKNPI